MSSKVRGDSATSRDAMMKLHSGARNASTDRHQCGNVLESGNRQHFAQAAGPADVALVALTLDQAAEQLFDQEVLGLRDSLHHLFGMGCQSLLQVADPHVVIDGQPEWRRIRRALREAARPHPHQRMLQQRQLIRIVAEIIEKAGRELRIHGSAADPCRSLDRFATLLPSQARRQILGAVDRFRQAHEQRAMAQEVRSHGEHYVDRLIALRGARQQQPHEGIGFVRVALLAEAEDLLELVHEH